MQIYNGNSSDKIKEMDVNETCFFPPEKLNSIRVLVHNISFSSEKEFRVHARREDGEKYVEVVRTK